jgi:RF-1 domain
MNGKKIGREPKSVSKRDQAEIMCADVHPATLPPLVLAPLCEFRTTRRSGPGGQNRNKVETAVILTHKASGISAEASERRTQGENRRAAMQRLRVELALKVRRTLEISIDRALEPSSLWRERCRGGRIQVNCDHEDFPALLAEALDVLRACQEEPVAAGAILGCTSSQLIKLLKQEYRSLELVNERRRLAARHPLR